jgi:peptidoglycan/LPS O-acetylase OafA/YrhL
MRSNVRPHTNHLPGLDLIRAVAIAWVMIYHASANFQLIPAADHWFINFGWVGVDLFFVLSGFLIASQLLRPLAKGQRPHYGRFFRRRLMRTVPAYLAVLAMYFLVPRSREWADIQPLWQFLTFTENLFIDVSSPKTFSHVWSLCVEEQFYIIFPTIVALLAIRPSAKKTCALIVGILLAGMAVRGYLWITNVAQMPRELSANADVQEYMTLIYYPTWSRLDGLLAGIAAAAIKIFRPQLWQMLTSRPNLLLASGLAGIALAILFFGHQIATFLPAVFGFPLLAFSIVLVVMAGTSTGSIIDRYRVPGASALATAAYSLYLSQKIAYHLVVAGIVSSFGATGYARLLLAIVTALVVGAVLYWLVERPFLKLRDRLDSRSLVDPAAGKRRPDRAAEKPVHA